MVKKATTPITVTIAPKIKKKQNQGLAERSAKVVTSSPSLIVVGTPRSPPIPSIAATANKGRTERLASTFGRLCSFVISVTCALKQASLLVEPKKVITQS